MSQAPSPFHGQILFGWVYRDCVANMPVEGTAARAHALDTLKASQCRTLAFKVADGVVNYNLRDSDPGPKYAWVDDLMPPFYQEVGKLNAPKLGWHYIYGNDPVREAEIAAARIDRLSLDGYILDPEVEYKSRNAQARKFMEVFRKLQPTIPLALCSYRFPKFHTDFPWKEFLGGMEVGRDVHMPQVYHADDYRINGLALQLQSSYDQLRALKPLEYIPTFALYKYGSWQPTRVQLERGKDKAIELGCKGLAYYALDDMLNELDKPFPALGTPTGYWDAIAYRAQSFAVTHEFKVYVPVINPPTTVEDRLARLEKAVFGN